MTEHSEEKLELQFDRAEPSQPPPSSQTPAATAVECASCGGRLLSYYSVNGRVTCKRCRDAAVARREGSHLPTLLTAAALGVVGALVGAAIYFAVAKITGYEIGFVAIVVGLIVGKAVQLGARGRGGWRYQALAVFLCYFAIAISYFTSVIVELRSQQQQEVAAAQAAPAPDAPPAGAPTTDAAPPRAAAPASAAPDAGQAALEEEPAPSGGAVAREMLLLILKLPFLVGKESPMAFVLIAIALWEAVKFNVERPFEASGPYAVGGAPLANG